MPFNVLDSHLQYLDAIDIVGADRFSNAPRRVWMGVYAHDLKSATEKFPCVAALARAKVQRPSLPHARGSGCAVSFPLVQCSHKRLAGRFARNSVVIRRPVSITPGICHTVRTMYANLRDFVDALERTGELKRVASTVSPILEITEIADRQSKSKAPSLPHESTRRTDPRFCDRGGHAVLFENVEGSDIPVLINAWGSYRRVEMALGCPAGLESIAARIAELVKPEPLRSLGEAWSKLRQLLPLLRIPPKRRKGSGICQQIVTTGDAVDLTRLPLIRCWPHDGDYAALGYPPGINDDVPGLGSGPEWETSFRGRYITLGGIHTIHASDEGNPRPASHNIGMYRVQLLGKQRMAMHWHMHHDGARHWRSWKAKGKPMPVAIVLGGESVMPYAATAPLPPGISELMLAGFLNQRGIPMVMGKTVPVWVPGNAEIVIEGFVSPEAGNVGWEPRSTQHSALNTSPLGPGAVLEGPFGDHTGFYSMPDRYPILDVTAITHRRDPIYPTTVVGLPPQEDYFLGKATERIFLPLLKTLIHDIEDYDLPIFGAFHNCAFVKVKKEYPFQARRVMHSIWGAGQMAWTKSIFVVDKDVDVHDHLAVLRAASEHCAPGRDVESVNGPVDILDHAAPRLGVGMKIGFDCTRKISGEETRSVFGAAAVGMPTVGGAAASIEHRRGIEAEVSRVEGVISATIPDALGGGWLLIRARKDRAGQGAQTAQRVARVLAGLPPVAIRVIILGPDVEIEKVDEAFFHWLANSDAGRDLTVVGETQTEIYDATPKLPGDEANGLPVRPWPPILAMPEAIKSNVSARLAALGL